MTSLPRIGIIIGTTREGRFADQPTQWLFDIASKRTDAVFELVDLRDYAMPFFNQKMSPGSTPVTEP